MNQPVPNVVEILADPEDCAFDQRCRFGHRVEDHAVYCRKDDWEDGPRKCHHMSGWHERTEDTHEECPGFEINPEYTHAFPYKGCTCEHCLKKTSLEKA